MQTYISGIISHGALAEPFYQALAAALDTYPAEQLYQLAAALPAEVSRSDDDAGWTIIWRGPLPPRILKLNYGSRSATRFAAVWQHEQELARPHQVMFVFSSEAEEEEDTTAASGDLSTLAAVAL